MSAARLAFAFTVLATVFFGVVALAVPATWDTVPCAVQVGLWILAGLSGVGAVVSGRLAWRAMIPTRNVGQLRTTLAKLQSEGQGLHEQINSVARGEAGQLQKPCEAWATKVARALEEGGESFRVGHFLDEQHYGDTFFATQHAEHSRLNNWMRRRLSRLGEIIRDL